MKDLLFNNFWLKMLSLMLAIVTWYAIHETISFEMVVTDIPIELQIKEGWAILQQSANTVDVTFRGSQEDIRLLDRRQIKAVVDLRTDPIKGTGQIALLPHYVQGARSVRAIHVNPDRIMLSLDSEVETRTPVKSRYIGKPLSGDVEELVCDPAMVVLRGPAQKLAMTEWLYTEPVDVDGRIESFTRRCRVLPPSNTWTPKIDPPEVMVKVVITEKSEHVEWKNIPVSMIVNSATPMKARISPGTVNIRVTGRPETLEGLTNTVPTAFVDCADLDPSLTYDLTVKVLVPAHNDVSIAADPSSVHVVLEEP